MERVLSLTPMPMQREKLRSNTEILLSVLAPIKITLPVPYVVNAKLWFSEASHSEKWRDVLSARASRGCPDTELPLIVIALSNFHIFFTYDMSVPIRGTRKQHQRII